MFEKVINKDKKFPLTGTVVGDEGKTVVIELDGGGRWWMPRKQFEDQWEERKQGFLSKLLSKLSDKTPRG